MQFYAGEYFPYASSCGSCLFWLNIALCGLSSHLHFKRLMREMTILLCIWTYSKIVDTFFLFLPLVTGNLIQHEIIYVEIYMLSLLIVLELVTAISHSIFYLFFLSINISTASQMQFFLFRLGQVRCEGIFNSRYTNKALQ